MSDAATRAEAKASAPQIRRKSVYLAAEVTGVDLAKPLDTTTVAALAQALAEHEVLIFPNQRINGDDLKRFGRYFNELTVNPFATNTEGAPELQILDNHEGNPPGGTDIWHTDETFREIPPMATILSCKVIPELGGDTCFHSMTAAYEALSDRMQQFLSGLEALHDIGLFREAFSKLEDGRKHIRKLEDRYPPVIHPVVRKHPVTGRKSLFVNAQFTQHIIGMEREESRKLLQDLYRVTAILEHQYRHRWGPDMVVMWDNRSVQHYAVHDYYPQRRFMERVTVKGDKPINAFSPADPATLRKFKMPPFHTSKTRSLRQFERD
jgi:taurine dioxygenase